MPGSSAPIVRISPAWMRACTSLSATPAARATSRAENTSGSSWANMGWLRSPWQNPCRRSCRRSSPTDRLFRPLVAGSVGQASPAQDGLSSYTVRHVVHKQSRHCHWRVERYRPRDGDRLFREWRVGRRGWARQDRAREHAGRAWARPERRPRRRRRSHHP